MMMIKNRFGFKLYQYYVYMKYFIMRKIQIMFYIVRTKKIYKKFEKSFQKYAEFHICNIRLLNMLNGKDNSDPISLKSIVGSDGSSVGIHWNP